MTKPFHLAWFMEYAPANWVDTYDSRNERWSDPEFFIDFARALDRACFDYVLVEDTSYIPNLHGGTMDVYIERSVGVPKGDPATLAGLMLEATENLVVCSTLSTNEYSPALLARMTSSMARLSEGRAGWNAVTGFDVRAMQNYGLDALPDHSLRYQRADEFSTEVEQAWARIGGPRPVVAQAGASDAGRAFAAKHADTIVCSAGTPETMIEYRNDVRRRLVEEGRDPDSCKVLFLMHPFVEETHEMGVAAFEAARRHRIEDPTLGMAIMSRHAGYDLSGYDLDAPIASLGIEAKGLKGLWAYIVAVSGDKTLREVSADEGILALAGSPETVGQQMIDIMEEVGGDGYLLIPEDMTYRNVNRITDGLVPELQRRGAVRTDPRNGLLEAIAASSS